MGISKKTVAKRMTAVPSDISTTLTPADSKGKRDLFEWSADKYGTVLVRAYLPEGVPFRAIKGHVLDFNDDATPAEDFDDNTRRGTIVARSVIMLDSAGKPSGYGKIADDHYDSTILVVVTVPNWAEVSTVTLK